MVDAMQLGIKVLNYTGIKVKRSNGADFVNQ
jgi:hypothetical protein